VPTAGLGIALRQLTAFSGNVPATAQNSTVQTVNYIDQAFVVSAKDVTPGLRSRGRPPV
jgi:hypothetical protein